MGPVLVRLESSTCSGFKTSQCSRDLTPREAGYVLQVPCLLFEKEVLEILGSDSALIYIGAALQTITISIASSKASHRHYWKLVTSFPCDIHLLLLAIKHKLIHACGSWRHQLADMIRAAVWKLSTTLIWLVSPHAQSRGTRDSSYHTEDHQFDRLDLLW